MRALRRIVIIGAGGHGREALQIVRAINAHSPTFELLGVLDDDVDASTSLRRVGTSVIGPPERLAELDATYVIALGHPVARKLVAQRLGTPTQEAAVLVHPLASVGDDVELSPGCILNAGSRVTTCTMLGRHVHLNTNSTVAHDSQLDDYSTLSPGANLAGTVRLGEGVFIGTNAAILPGCSVGAWTVVGAGAVVTCDLPPGITAVGVPARPLEPVR